MGGHWVRPSRNSSTRLFVTTFITFDFGGTHLRQVRSAFFVSRPIPRRCACFYTKSPHRKRTVSPSFFSQSKLYTSSRYSFFPSNRRTASSRFSFSSSSRRTASRQPSFFPSSRRTTSRQPSFFQVELVPCSDSMIFLDMMKNEASANTISQNEIPKHTPTHLYSEIHS